MKIPLRVHEADTNERNPEVAGLLAVIAGEHAETARVDRERLVQRELGGEVGDRSGVVAEPVLPPGVLRTAGAIERQRSPAMRKSPPIVFARPRIFASPCALPALSA